MCGIYGFSKINDVARQLSPLLALQMESRGNDSWGATDGHEIIKRGGAISNSYTLPSTWSRGIFHTRNATSGSRNIPENAHPHQVDHIIGIHNGIIGNDTAMNTKYGRDFKVDSIHIFAHLAEGHDMDELNGYAACAWYDTRDEEDRVWLWRSNNEALHVAELADGNCVFASTDSAIVRATTMVGIDIVTFYEVEENIKYYLAFCTDLNKWRLFFDDKMRLGSRYTYDARTHGAGRQHLESEWFGSDEYDGGFNQINTSYKRFSKDYYTGQEASSVSALDGSLVCVRDVKVKCKGITKPGEALCVECLGTLALEASDSIDIPNGLCNAIESAALEIADVATKTSEGNTKQNSAAS